ncbi:hypothetical protein BC6307_19390 [Sutcliffiella cohnii]|uniref:Uncharacterized protein n=1 Tax=Sutcliffiella cohnii TaxID=33932 RepID=A0A223KV67_9BACI|nr:hypothetical protein [Sutcliffiella cohnii]AST93267.1 hypothetical protein BC6307_19390 [Sutcliffiella cohnii]
MTNENKKVVCVIMEVETNKPEFFKGYRISEQGYYLVEIDGVAVIATLMPSNDNENCLEILNELFALKMNDDVRELITNPNMSAADLLLLMERFQVEV